MLNKEKILNLITSAMYGDMLQPGSGGEDMNILGALIQPPSGEWGWRATVDQRDIKEWPGLNGRSGVGG